MTVGPLPLPSAWLPEGKAAGVCFTVDDVHPARSTDAYEAGGDLSRGALGHVEWLLDRHPLLRVTLFVTADWRQISPRPTRKVLARIPVLRDRFFLAPILPRGTMRLDRHPEFVSYVSSLPRTELALHGLSHVHRGPRIPVEFQGEPFDECVGILNEAREIFREAGLSPPRGLNPPGWELPRPLAEALVETGMSYVASARDVQTAIASGARTAMSGLQGVSLLFPERIQGGRLVHLTSNFQATSHVSRALEIVAHRGLLAVKAHIVKHALSHVQLDGLDVSYRNDLDELFTLLEDRYGDSLWWTSMGDVAARVMALDGGLAGLR